MANHTVASPPSNTNQENLAPSADPLANVRSTAREALAGHIDRSAKQSGKRSRGPRSSDAEKVESLLCFVDGAEIAFALVDDAKRYLSSISNVGNSNGPSASVDIAIEALNLALAAGRRQLKGTRLAVDNTSAKALRSQRAALEQRLRLEQGTARPCDCAPRRCPARSSTARGTPRTSCRSGPRSPRPPSPRAPRC